MNSPTPLDLHPHDVDAEKAVLGSLLIDNEVIPTVAGILAREEFYVERHRHVYDAIGRLYDDGGPVDLVTLADRLRMSGHLESVGGIAYLVGLAEGTPTAAYADHYARIVSQKASLRDIITTAQRAIALAAAGDGDPEGIIAAAQAEVTQLLVRGVRGEFDPSHEVAGDVADYVAYLAKNKGALTGATSGLPDLDKLLHGFQPGSIYIVAGRPSMGKALDVETPIPTTRGYVRMGDLVPGDRVFGPDGQPTEVVAATEWMHDRPCYEVTFDDGTTLVADAEHQWQTHTRNPRGGVGIRTTVEIMATLTAGGKRWNHRIPAAAPAEFPPAKLPVDPYLLGVWLGDGTSASATLSLGERDASHIGAELGSRGVPLARREHQTSGSVTVGLSAGRGGPRAANVQTALRRLGVLGNKHIPACYLSASPQQRADLLRGLLDTDGHVEKGGHVELTLTRDVLARDALRLLRSLGHVPYVNEYDAVLDGRVVGRRWRIGFMPVGPHPIVSVPFKGARVRRGADSRAGHRRIVAVTAVPSRPVRCIRVARRDGLFQAGEAHIITHNSALALKAAFAAAVTGKRVGVFSLEMPNRDLGLRIACAEGKVDSERVRRGELTDRDWQRLADALGRFSAAPMWFNDLADLSMNQVRAKARTLAAREGVDMLVIDYLQLIGADSGRSENRVQEVSKMSRGFKLLARELDVPVIVLSQLSRQVEARPNKRPVLSDLRESGSIEQDADVVMMLYRDDYYDPESADAGIAEIIVQKNRNGALGTVKATWIPTHASFESLTRREAPPAPSRFTN
jgi:replicative DNA helicase